VAPSAKRQQGKSVALAQALRVASFHSADTGARPLQRRGYVMNFSEFVLLTECGRTALEQDADTSGELTE
jgi:hypothetical protein